jgi:hypothetical protein
VVGFGGGPAGRKCEDDRSRAHALQHARNHRQAQRAWKAD